MTPCFTSRSPIRLATGCPLAEASTFVLATASMPPNPAPTAPAEAPAGEAPVRSARDDAALPEPRHRRYDVDLNCISARGRSRLIRDAERRSLEATPTRARRSRGPRTVEIGGGERARHGTADMSLIPDSAGRP